MRNAASPWIFCLRIQGRFIPSCDEDGFYRKLQCDRGDCWCVDQNGGEVAGTRTRGKTDCGEVANARTDKCNFNLEVLKYAQQFGPLQHTPHTHTHSRKHTRLPLCKNMAARCIITHCGTGGTFMCPVICILKPCLSLWEKSFRINEPQLNWTYVW